MIEDMVCEHSLIYSRGSMGFTELTDDEKAMMKPVRQRLVRTHPVTGRKSLLFSPRMPATSSAAGAGKKSRDLLRDSMSTPRSASSSCPPWRAYDLVMWDNRQTMHRVRRFDESQPRDMRRTTVAGEAMTVEAGGSRIIATSDVGRGKARSACPPHCTRARFALPALRSHRGAAEFRIRNSFERVGSPAVAGAQTNRSFRTARRLA